VRAKVAKLAALSVYVASALLAIFLPSHLCYSTFRNLFVSGRCDVVSPFASVPENSGLVNPHIDRQLGLRLAILGIGALISAVILLIGLPPSDHDE
jgi:hypothetical protein